MADQLPRLSTLPIGLAIYSGIGYISGKIAGSSPSTWAKIYAINILATNILYHAVSALTDDLKKKHYIWACLCATGSIAKIVALRQLNLIATTGTIVLGTLSAFVIIGLLSEAQKH